MSRIDKTNQIDLHHELMIYGWRHMEERMAETATGKVFSMCSDITASLGISDENSNHLIRTFRAFLEGFSLLVNNNAFGHALPVEDSFELSLKVLIAGMKELEENKVWEAENEEFYQERDNRMEELGGVLVSDCLCSDYRTEYLLG